MKPNMKIFDSMKMTKLKIMTAAICSVICMATASAQVAVRADVGAMYYYGLSPAESGIGVMPGLGAQLGADYDLHVKGTFYVTPGLNWSYRFVAASNFADATGNEFIHEHFLNVPLYFKWKFNIKPDKFGMQVYFGPVYSFGLASHSRLDMMASGIHITGTYDYYRKVADIELDGESSGSLVDAVKEQIEDAGLRFKRFDIRLDFGVGFMLKRNNELVLGFDIGTFNRSANNLDMNTYMNSCNFYLGYRYRFGKKQ